MSGVGVPRQEELGRIREALFGKEMQLLALIADRIETHDKKLGTDAGLAEAVAKVLADALKLSEGQDHQRIAAAMAPLVIDTIRTEIRNSKEEIVEALYPMTGKLVSAYVSENISKMMSRTDNRLRSWFSLFKIWLLLKSFVTGIPYRKLKLIHQFGVRLEQVLVVKRGAGTIVDEWTADKPKSRNSGPSQQMVAGMLSAINDFANEALASEHGALQTLDLGGSHLHLRATPTYIIAVKCSGRSSGDLNRHIDKAMIPALRTLNRDSRQIERDEAAGKMVNIAAAFARQLETAVLKYMPLQPRRPTFAYALFGIIGALCIVSLGNTAAKEIKDRLTSRRVSEVIASATSPGTGASQVQFGVFGGGQEIKLSGFMSSQAEAENLMKSLQAIAPEATIKNELLVLNLPLGSSPLIQTTQRLVGGTLNVVGHTLNEVDQVVARLLVLEQKVANSLVNLLSATAPRLGPTLNVTNQTLQSTLQGTHQILNSTLSASQSLVRNQLYNNIVRKLPQDIALKVPLDDKFLLSAVANLEKSLQVKNPGKTLLAPKGFAANAAARPHVSWDALGHRPLLPELDAVVTENGVHVGVVSIDGKTGRILGGTANALFGAGRNTIDTTYNTLEGTANAVSGVVANTTTGVNTTTDALGNVVVATTNELGAVTGNVADSFAQTPVVGPVTGAVANTLQGPLVPAVTNTVTGTVTNTTTALSNTVTGVGKLGTGVVGKVLKKP